MAGLKKVSLVPKTLGGTSKASGCQCSGNCFVSSEPSSTVVLTWYQNSTKASKNYTVSWPR